MSIKINYHNCQGIHTSTHKLNIRGKETTVRDLYIVDEDGEKLHITIFGKEDQKCLKIKSHRTDMKAYLAACSIN